MAKQDKVVLNDENVNTESGNAILDEAITAQAPAPSIPQAPAAAPVVGDVTSALLALESKPAEALISTEAKYRTVKPGEKFAAIFTGRTYSIPDKFNGGNGVVPAVEFYAKENGAAVCFITSDAVIVRKVSELVAKGEIIPGEKSGMYLLVVPTVQTVTKGGYKIYATEFFKDSI